MPTTQQVVVPESSGTVANAALRRYAEELRKQFRLEKRILLIQAPQFLFETINLEVIRNRGYYAYPPTGLQWLQQALAGRGFDIQIADLNFELLERIVEDPSYDPRNWLELLDAHLAKRNPSIVGVTCLTVYTDLFETQHPLTGILRHVVSRNRHVVIAGGPTASNETEGYLSRGLSHFVIEGEGENRMKFLLDVLLDSPVPAPATGGIYFRPGARVLRSEGGDEPVLLKGNLIPTYASVPVEKYCRVGCLNPYSRMVGKDTVYGVFQLNRGCRWNCRFCGVRGFMGKGVRTHAVPELLEEVRYLVEQRGVRHFEVLDDDFLTNTAALKDFLKGLVPFRKTHGITWAANNGMVASSLTEEILALMRDSGSVGFKVGFESGNPEMLRKMRKPGNLTAFHRVGEMLRGFPELFVGGNYIIGLFGEETFGQIMDTFRLACRLQLDWASFTVFQVTSRLTAQKEHLKGEGRSATDFIPAKNTVSRNIEEDRRIPLGPGIFYLPPETVPDRFQLNNIWFTFNLYANYIGNKNLQPGKPAGKFVGWVESLLVTYPQNPYMHLFAALGWTLMNQAQRAGVYWARSRSIVAQSEMWKHRFAATGLGIFMDQFPSAPGPALEKIEMLRGRYRQKWNP